MQCSVHDVSLASDWLGGWGFSRVFVYCLVAVSLCYFDAFLPLEFVKLEILLQLFLVFISYCHHYWLIAACSSSNVSDFQFL